jgi:hypothetical protein
MNFRYFLKSLLIIILQTENAGSKMVIDNMNLVHSLIRRSFSGKQCLYLIIGANLTHSDHTSTLFNLQIVSVNLNDIKNLNSLSFVCEGYIIFSNRMDDINSLFTLELINNYFKPHKNILLFTKSSKNINIQEVYAATELHDLNLVIVEDMKLNTAMGVGKRAIFVPEEAKQIPTSVHQLYSLNVSRNSVFLKKPKWSPPNVLAKFNQTFSVAFFDCPPFAVFNETSHIYDGVEIKMLNEILKDWPTYYDFLKPRKNSGEYLYGNILRRVRQDNYDLGICTPWQQTVYKYNIAKSVEYTVMCKNFLVPRPKLLSNYSFIFQSLLLNIWFLYFLTLTCCSLITYIMSVLLNRLSSTDSSKYTLERIILYLIRVFSLGSIYRIPHQNISSVRLLLTSICIFCLLISIYYSAGLTISLRFPRFSKKIDALQDIVENNIKWLEPNDWMKHWMKNTTSDILHKLADQFEAYHSIPERNKKMRNGNYALFVETLPGLTKNYYVMLTESLDEYGRKELKIVAENVGCFYTVFPLKENSPYLDIFNRAIHNFIEFGFMNYWFQDFVNKPKYRFMKNFFQRYSTEVHQVIDLEKLQGAFFLLIIGLALSALVFICECITSQYLAARSRSKS